MARLGEACISTEKRDPRTTPNLPFRYVDISGVNNRLKQITETRTILGQDAPSRARQLIKANDVLVATTRPNLNAIALVPEELNNEICSTGFCVLRPTEAINPLFLFFLAQTQYFIDTISGQVKGMLYPAVTENQVRSIYIPIPSLPEQKRIATKLRELMQEVERTRTACEKQLEAAKALPAAYLREVFESEEAKKWERKRLGKVAKYINGRAFKPEEWKQAGIPIIRIQNLNNPNAPYNYYDVEIEERYKVKNNDLLISWSASLGVYLWTHGDAVLNQHIFKVEEYPELALKNFLCFAIDYVMTEIRKRIHGATMQHITRPEFEAIFIPVPTLPVQQRIAAKLKEKMAEAEKLRTAIEKQLEAINALPQTILRKAFRGKL